MRLFQKLFPPTPEPTAAEIQQRLMEILDFNTDDLIENQHGRMTAHQHYWLIDLWLRQTLLYIGGIIAVGAILHFSAARSMGDTDNVAWILLLAVALVGFSIASIMALGEMVVDIVKRAVGVACGLGTLSRARRHKRYAYRLYIDDEQLGKETYFEISRNLYNVLLDNKYYTVYYALRSKVILAIEVD